jgi:hypothetical protein
VPGGGRDSGAASIPGRSEYKRVRRDTGEGEGEGGSDDSSVSR